jgi:Zn-dependent protease
VPKLVPFLGAYVKHAPVEKWDHRFLIAIAGPALGGIFGILFFYMNMVFEWSLFHALAYYSLLINLINLAPVSILDGGHILSALSYKKLHFFMNLSIIVLGIYLNKDIFLIILGSLGLIFSIGSLTEKDQIKTKKDKETKYGFLVIYILLMIILSVHLYFIFDEPPKRKAQNKWRSEVIEFMSNTDNFIT